MILAISIKTTYREQFKTESKRSQGGRWLTRIRCCRRQIRPYLNNATGTSFISVAKSDKDSKAVEKTYNVSNGRQHLLKLWRLNGMVPIIWLIHWNFQLLYVNGTHDLSCSSCSKRSHQWCLTLTPSNTQKQLKEWHVIVFFDQSGVTLGAASAQLPFCSILEQRTSKKCALKCDTCAEQFYFLWNQLTFSLLSSSWLL